MGEDFVDNSRDFLRSAVVVYVQLSLRHLNKLQAILRTGTGEGHETAPVHLPIRHCYEAFVLRPIVPLEAGFRSDTGERINKGFIRRRFRSVLALRVNLTGEKASRR